MRKPNRTEARNCGPPSPKALSRGIPIRTVDIAVVGTRSMRLAEFASGPLPVRGRADFNVIAASIGRLDGSCISTKPGSGGLAHMGFTWPIDDFVVPEE